MQENTVPENEVHVWLMRMPALLSDALLAMVVPEEQQRAGNMSHRRQREWVGGRALLRQCLAHYTGCHASGLVFGKTEAGKPFLDLPDAPAFNLSHGPDWIACAVAHAGDIGIDIDSELRRNRTDDIAERYFHPLEQAELAEARDARQRQHIFFRQWTLKEAYIKALGETINSIHLRDIVFDCTAGDTPQPLFFLPDGHWQFLHKYFDEGHHLALACRRNNSTGIACRFWLWDAATQSRHELTDPWLQAA